MYVYVGVFAYYKNYILLIQEEDVLNSAKSNLWSLPGGGPDSNNLAYEAAREFDEETYGIISSREIIYNKLLQCKYYDNGRVRIYYLPLEDIINVKYMNNLNQIFLNVYKFLNNNCVQKGQYKAIICNDKHDILLETKNLELYNVDYILNNLKMLRIELRKDFNDILNFL